MNLCDLPAEIVQDILSRLHLNDLAACARVCPLLEQHCNKVRRRNQAFMDAYAYYDALQPHISYRWYDKLHVNVITRVIPVLLEPISPIKVKGQQQASM